jgi:hypothetical protein
MIITSVPSTDTPIAAKLWSGFASYLQGRLFSPTVLAVIVLSLLGYGPASADEPRGTPAEYAMIPKWCAYSNPGALTPIVGERGASPEVRAKVLQLRHAGCSGIHHYCWALIWSNRAFLNDTSDYDRQFHYSVAISDHQYVLDQSNKSCPMIPELYTKQGELYALSNKPQDAEAKFRQALGVKASYAAAYIGLSDLYETQGATDKALAALQAGIKANPKSTALQKKLQRVQQRASGTAAQP